MKNYISHHGIKGQKWGVRRYQNYDGSYTAAGLKRYQKAAEAYEKVNTSYKKARAAYKEGKITKEQLHKVSRDRRAAKNIANKAYKRLRNDHKADLGKDLVQQGYNITELNSDLNRRQVIGGGSLGLAAYGAGNAVYRKTGNIYNGLYTTAAISAMSSGALAVDKFLTGQKMRNIRSYYSHNTGAWKQSEATINRLMKEYGNEE